MNHDVIRRSIEIIFYREDTEEKQIEVKKSLLAEYDRLTAELVEYKKSNEYLNKQNDYLTKQANYYMERAALMAQLLEACKLALNDPSGAKYILETAIRVAEEY